MDDLHQAGITQVNRAWEWFAGMIALSATNLGIELGIFDLLKEAGPLTPAEIASRLGLQGRAVDLWAKTLVHYELLVPVGGDRVQMAPGVELMVCEPKSVFSLGPSFAYHAKFLARDFLDLPQFFRDGRPIPPSRHGASLSRNIAEQTELMHALFVQAILPDLDEVVARLVAGAKVLDVGCGEGHLGLSLCSAFEFVRYVGYDLDEPAVTAGRARALRAGFAGRFDLVQADATTLPSDRSFDLALLFLALHEVPLQQRPALAAAIRHALKPGSMLLILDETYPATLADAAMRGARMGLHFEYTELLWGSRVPTEAEVGELLAGAGFTGIERLRMLDGSFELVVARA